MAVPGDLGGVFEPGEAVEVRNRFEGSWSHGFEVVEAVVGPGADPAYRYRLRHVGGALLPLWFSADEISLPRNHGAPTVSRLEQPSTRVRGSLDCASASAQASGDSAAVLRRNHASCSAPSDGCDYDPEARDRQADKRDVSANRRDREADRRDQAAEVRDQDASGQKTRPGRPDPLALARLQSAADRVAAATDRSKNRVDRNNAAEDRHRASGERKAAAKDDLTGLLRRGVGLTELQREVERSRRSGDPVAVAFLDVDGLKHINDERGHQAGDAALRAVADGLRATMRSYDLMARYGGDEFLTASPGMGTPELKHRMLSMRTDLAAAPQPVSVSFGLAELQSDDHVEALVARADDALYHERRRRSRKPRPA